MTYARLMQDYQAQNGYGNPVTVGPPGGGWGQFPHSYHVQAVGAIGTVVYTFSPNLINEVSWGINRGKQGVDPLDDTSSNTNNGGAKTYEDSLLPLKDAQRQRAARCRASTRAATSWVCCRRSTSACPVPASARSLPVRASAALPRSATTAAGRSPGPTSCRPSRTRSPG